jgi:D-alanyl-D-alanine carboxypeptidase
VLNDDNLVHITAQKWLIYDCQKGIAIKGFKYKKQHDVASLSKLLTFYTAFMIIKEYKLSIDKIDFIVMKEDEDLGGTKISIKKENIIKLEDCLYAMLLNSANNAATVLANNLGFLCLRKRENLYFSCFDIN